MPYRRTYRKRAVRRRRPVRASYTRKVARREAYKAINKKTETKYVDGIVTGAITATSATGTLLSLHGTYGTGSFVAMTQGTDFNQYIGQWIKPTWLKIRYAFDLADNANIVSVIVVQAKGSWVNGGTMASIYDTVTAGTTTAPFGDLNSAFSTRFRVLYRRQHNLNAAANDVIMGKIRISPRQLRKLNFSDNAGAVESGHIMLGCISDSTAVSHPSLRCKWRLYFKDS
jgi:hypothetical protein